MVLDEVDRLLDMGFEQTILAHTLITHTSNLILSISRSFTLTKLRWVVLDEVDRLLDMGFEQTILEILSTLRGSRLPGKTHAFSALLTPYEHTFLHLVNTPCQHALLEHSTRFTTAR